MLNFGCAFNQEINLSNNINLTHLTFYVILIKK